MNERVWIAQADTTPVQNPAPLKVVTVVKPGSEQAITIDLGFDQKTKVDLSAVANEKMTMVHVGTKLIVLFDNHSTVTIEPFFDSTGKPLANLDVNLGAGHDVTGDQFASLFPITEDQSVLPAAGGGGSPASGADFHNPTVDPLAIGNPLPLLGPEELGNFQVNLPLGPQSNFIDTAPDITLTPADVDLNGHNIVDEAGIVAHIGQPGGTAAGNGSAVAHGTFALSDVDGLADIKSLTINGTVIAIADLVTATTATPIVGSNGHGTLVITDYDPTTGIGHYTYTLNTSVTESPAQNNGTDTVADGDSFTIVVTDNSNIASNPATLLVDIKDDVPSITVSQSVPTLTVDESFLPNGTTPDPGLGHTVDTADFSSAFTVVEGADGGTVSYALTLVSGSSNLIDTATGQAVVLTESGNTISGYVTGHVGDSSYLVFTLSVDAASGSATLTQDRAVHELDTSNNNEGISLDSNLVTLTVTATDGDGDVTSKTLDLGSSVTFQDDGPVLLANASTTATVDEDNIHDLLTHGSSPDFFGGTDLLGAAYTTGSLSGLVDFGADGKGSFSFVTGAERTSALASLNALGLTSHGEALTFSISNLTGDLIATTGSGFNTHVVLDLHLSSNGSYIVQLFDAIDHDTPPANTADENTTLQEHGQNTQVDSIDFGQIIQATDGDGDHVTLDGAFNVKVIDDVPHVSLSTNPIVYVGIDESAGSQDGFLGLPPNDTTSSSVRNIFATFEATHAGTDLGNDTDIAHAVAGSPAIAYAHGAGPLVIPNIAGGADGVSSIVYSLQVSSTGVYSGVQTTDGHNIYLYEDAATGLIVGRVGGTDPAHNDANANGTIAFAIAIESDGDIDIAQYLSLKEFDTSKNNETVSLADGAIQAKVIVTDGDGDTASDTTNIGSHILFYDDGPSVSVAAVSDANVVITTYDILGGSDSSTALFGSLFTATPTYGADGEGSGPAWSYSLNINGFGNHVNSGLTAIVGGKIYLAELSDGTIVGYTGSQAPHSIDSSVVFSISVDGNGTVTLTQYAAINHGSGDLASLADSLIQLTASANVTDGDGDGGSGSKTINIGANLHFQDTMPSAGSNNTVKLDDETAVHTYATQNAGGTGDVPASNTTGTLAHTFGADGAGSVLLQSATLPANEGFSQVVTNGGKTLTIYQEQNGHTVAVVQVSLTDSTSGNYTVTELNPIFQLTHSTTEDNVQFTVNYQVTDGDSDAAPGSLLISVNDDTPTLGAIESITVSDNAIHTGTIAFSAGADGVGTGVLSGTPPANLTSGGQAVHYWVSADGHTLIGYTGSAPSGSDQPDPSHQVFVLTLNANDQGYSYQQIQEFDNAHTTTDFIGNSNFSYPNAPNGEVDVTYSGGTIAKVTGSGNVNGSSTGWGIGSDTFTGADHLHFDFKQSDTGTATSSVTYSFHKDGSVDYVVHYSDGTSDTVSGYAATKDGTLTLTAPTGATIDSVDFTGNAGTPNGGFKIVLDGADVDTTTTSPTSDLGFHVALTDGDGDAVGGDFTVSTHNNAPLAISGEVTGTVYEDALAHANVDPNTTPTGEIHGNLATGLSYSGDEGGLSFSFTSLGGSQQQVHTTDSNHPLLTSGGHPVFFYQQDATTLIGYTDNDSSGTHNNGDTTIFTLTLNQTTGDYQFTLNGPIDQPINPTEDTLSLDLGGRIQVTDTSDAGDTQAIQNFTIGVVDDVPLAANQSNTVNEGGGTNLILMIDTSGSVNGTTLAHEKTAAINLLNAGLGGGQVLIVDFDSSAHASGWLSVSDAITYINGLQSGGDTNYEKALDKVMDFVQANPTPDASQTVAYFLSDGQPTEGHISTTGPGNDQAVWENFLTTQNIAVYGVNFSGTSGDSDIAPIAYPNDSSHNVGIGTNGTTLPAYPAGTPHEVTGNVLTGEHFGADGAGNGVGLQSITIGGIVYTYDSAAGHITYNDGTAHTLNGTTLDVHTTLGELNFNFANGDYSYSTSASVSSNQTETFHFTIVDKDGDAAGADLNITIKNVLHAPTGLDLSSSDDTGSSNTDNITHQLSALTVSGTAENGTTVTLFDDTNHDGILNNGEVTLASNVTVTNGTFSTDVTLAGDGTHHVVAFETDGSGNTSPTSTPLDIVIDTTPPAVAVTGIQNDTGTVGDHITSDNRLVIQGTAEAGASVDVYRGSTYVDTTTADSTGHWSINDGTTLGNGNTYQYTAIAEDVAGNSATSAAYAVTIDRTAPEVTVDVVTEPMNIANNTSVVTFDFTEAPVGFDASDIHVSGGASISGFTGSGTHYQATLTANAGYEGNVTVSVSDNTFTDAAGNGGDGDSDSVAVDTKAPTAGTLSFDNFSDNGGTQNPPITNDTSFKLDLSGEGSGTVTYQVSTDGGGHWTTTSTNQNNLGDGDYQYRAIVTDSAGNSSISNVVEVVIDTVKPSVVSIAMSDTALTTGETSTVTIKFSEAVTGFSSSDVTSPNGNLGSLSSADGGVTWTGTFTPNNNVADTTNVLSIAANSYTDLAGNNGLGGSSDNYTINTHVNQAPVAGADTIYVSDSTAVAIPLSVLLANDHDPDGGTLQITDATAVSGLTGTPDVSVHDNAANFTTPGLNSDDTSGNSFQYTLVDGQGGSSSGTVNVNVLDVNNNGNDTVDLHNNTYQYAFINTGSGNDSLTLGSGIDNFNGGLGADTFIVHDRTDLGTDDIIDGGLEKSTTDTLRLDDGGTYDLTTFNIKNIDQLVLSDNHSFNITIGNAMVSTADFDHNGTGGDLGISADTTITSDVTIDASSLTGTNHITLDGSNFRGDDIFKGGAGDDAISGGRGDDTLIGGGGIDTLQGNSGSDHFQFNALSDLGDHIVDFSHSDGDVIDLLASAFGSVSWKGDGSLNESIYTGNDAASHNLSSSQHFAYDQSTGTLYYDSNGGSDASRVVLAVLDNHAAIQATDIHKV